MARELPVIFLIDNSQDMFGKIHHGFVKKIHKIKESMVLNPNLLEICRVMVWSVNRVVNPLNGFQDLSEVFVSNEESKIKIVNSRRSESNFGAAFNQLNLVLGGRDIQKSHKPLVISFMPKLPTDEWREAAGKLKEIADVVCIAEASIISDISSVIKDIYSIDENWDVGYHMRQYFWS